jgi:hypothetical protein
LSRLPQGADGGDTTPIGNTLAATVEQPETVADGSDTLVETGAEVVANKWYHSRRTGARARDERLPGMRRTHLRGHTDILKRLLILAGTSRLNRMHGVRLDADTRDVDWGACGNQPRDGITTVSG